MILFLQAGVGGAAAALWLAATIAAQSAP